MTDCCTRMEPLRTDLSEGTRTIDHTFLTQRGWLWLNTVTGKMLPEHMTIVI